jgi:DNA modification methylase
MNISEMPSDFEACGDCGFDHTYESRFANEWHEKNPGSYTVQVIRGDTFAVTANWPSACIDLIVTDPPYGRIVTAEWDRKWSYVEFDRLGTVIERLLKPGGTAYVWGGIGTYKDRGFFKWLGRVEDMTALRIHDVITWRKRRGYGKAHGYLFTREECVMFVKPDEERENRRLAAADINPKTFNIPLLDVKRGYPGYNAKYQAKSEYLRRTNVWDDVTEILKGKIHECEKPSRLAEIMIETSSHPNELVVDLFAGSGSTGVAARKLGRRVVLIEQSNCEMHVQTG